MLKSYDYRGLIIQESCRSCFNTKYWSVLNPNKNNKNGQKLHTHTTSKAAAKKIVDCYLQLVHTGVTDVKKYNRYIRNKACRLLGFNVLMK